MWWERVGGTTPYLDVEGVHRRPLGLSHPWGQVYGRGTDDGRDGVRTRVRVRTHGSRGSPLVLTVLLPYPSLLSASSPESTTQNTNLDSSNSLRRCRSRCVYGDQVHQSTTGFRTSFWNLRG